MFKLKFNTLICHCWMCVLLNFEEIEKMFLVLFDCQCHFFACEPLILLKSPENSHFFMYLLHFPTKPHLMKYYIIMHIISSCFQLLKQKSSVLK